MARWNILVADDLAPEGLAILERAGRVVVRRGMGPGDLRDALPGVHALVLRSATRVTRASLADAGDLLVIGRAGIGLDNVDVGAATERGIAVMNTPESGAVTTAEHAIAMLLALSRRIPAADRLLHEGRWEKGGLLGVEITGKTLGLVGLGRIGRVVADRARGLRMRVIACDPYVAKDRVPEGVLLVSFDRCLAEADFVSVHVPLLDETHHLLDRAAFRKVKEGSRLIHCARGGIVDEAALLEALEAGRLAGAALDVFEREPLDPGHPLLARPGVVCTPHLGASTEEARRAVARDIARQVVTCLETGTVVNGVNVPPLAPADADYLAPFLELARRLASFLVQAFGGELDRLTIDMQGEFGLRGEAPVRLAALTGALRALGLRATPVNAAEIARDRDVVVAATQRMITKGYVDYLQVEAVLDGRPRSAAGTLLGGRGLRMVELEHAPVDAAPRGELLLTLHEDQPGVIGRIGTILGEAGVNISRMQIGVQAGGTRDAIGLLALDARPPDRLVGAIRDLPFVRRACVVSLPENG